MFFTPNSQLPDGSLTENPVFACLTVSPAGDDAGRASGRPSRGGTPEPRPRPWWDVSDTLRLAGGSPVALAGDKSQPVASSDIETHSVLPALSPSDPSLRDPEAQRVQPGG